jgi:antirestriction protein
MPDLKDNEFQCAMCGGIFEKEVSEEVALEEKEALFPGVPVSQCDIVCDECFKIVCAQLTDTAEVPE